MLEPADVLILDEPTNDLDVMTLQVLEDFLEDFPGCLLVVTHDRYFMDRLVEHLFVFEGHGKIKDFNGTYLEYRMLKKEEDSRKRAEERQAAPAGTAAKAGLSNAERNEMKKLEKDIAKMESRKAEILARFNAGELGVEEAGKLSAELGKLQEELDIREMRWLELSEL
jgi:ATP-binding cassette subfamily F protein uup